MNTISTSRSTNTFAKLSTLLLAFCVSTLFGCSDQITNPGLATDIDIPEQVVSQSLSYPDLETIEGTMQISPHMINVQSNGAAESVRAIIGLGIPGGYRVTDFDFTLSFNDEDVTKAYDCYYCYVDNNLIISFGKSEVISSPVTLEFVNTEVVAAVNGYFRLESDSDSYDTQVSTVASVEIVGPAQAEPVKK